MKPNPVEESTLLLSLDRLEVAERAAAAAALAKDPALAAELRSSEDAIALAWQAASPLHLAPASSLPKIFAAIGEEDHARRKLAARKQETATPQPARARWTTALPWAAALAFALLYFTKDSSAPRPDDSAAKPTDLPSEHRRIPQSTPSTDGSLATAARLRNRLEAADLSESAALRPRIRPLFAPGGERSAAPDPAATRTALLNLLTEALASGLERANEAPSDLVIETGWITDLAAAIETEAIVRHRDFPIDEAAQLGLLSSPDGVTWYDPANGMIWSPAADGGGHLGRPAPPDLDLAGFQAPAAPPRRETPAEKQQQSGESPEGYLVSDPDTGTSTLVMNHLITSNFREVIVIPVGTQGFAYPVENIASAGTVLLDFPAIYQNRDFTVVGTNALTGERVTILSSSGPGGTLGEGP